MMKKSQKMTKKTARDRQTDGQTRCSCKDPC